MQKEPKVIIDTNIFVSCLIGKSKTLSQIYRIFLEGGFTPILSLEMHLELLDVLNRPELREYFNNKERKRLKELLNTDAIIVPTTKDVHLCRDPKDNIILACALSSPFPPECIVTGDNDLLVLKSFHGIPIVKPKAFLEHLNK